ncbi:MAG: cytochrome P450 [Actinomycetaceae bacterium]|nr:cytochrome P450 [Actinomycetaceae bacterium]
MSTDSAPAKRCPVSHDGGVYTVSGHPEAYEVANDPAKFSSRVSVHLNLPNGLDGEEHRQWRGLVDKYLADERVVPLYSMFEEVAEQIIAGLPRGEKVDVLTEIGRPLAVRAQSRWLGWDSSFEGELLAWMDRKQAAVKAGDREELAAVADDFDDLIRRLIASPAAGSPSEELRSERVGSTQRPIAHEEIVAVLRNWTAGDLESIAASITVVVNQLAAGAEGAEEKRAAMRSIPDAAIDEMLRIDDPFVSNRRIATEDVELSGVTIPGGSRVLINWREANLDEQVFGDGFDPKAHEGDNLVFGTGPHYCPGHTLSTLQIRAAVLALMDGVEDFRLADTAQEDVAEGTYPPVVLS